jgi:hypothetical protein
LSSKPLYRQGTTGAEKPCSDYKCFFVKLSNPKCTGFALLNAALVIPHLHNARSNNKASKNKSPQKGNQRLHKSFFQSKKVGFECGSSLLPYRMALNSEDKTTEAEQYQ